MPIDSKQFAIVLAVGLCFSPAKAGTSVDVSNQRSDLSSGLAWTPSTVPTGTDAAVWDSNSINTAPSTALIDSFTTSTTSFGSINLNLWNKTVDINSTGSTNSDSNVITLVSNPAISTTSVALNIGNLKVDPASGHSASFNLLHSLTLTGSLGTKAGTSTTITVNDGGPLNLRGSSNSGSVATGEVNLTFQNHTNLTLGNNSAKTFGLLTINGNTSLTQDNHGAASSLNNPHDNSSFAISAKSQATFTGGLEIASGTLTIYGWQGSKLGSSSSGEQLLFGDTGLKTGIEITDVIFDLATNQAGPTGSSYDPGSGKDQGAQYDYGEWISDPSNSGLDELVPYAAVPEPKTILAALAILGAVGYRERRRIVSLGAFFNPKNCL